MHENDSDWWWHSASSDVVKSWPIKRSSGKKDGETEKHVETASYVNAVIYFYAFTLAFAVLSIANVFFQNL